MLFQVFEPIALATDLIQRDSESYVGILIPMVMYTFRTLRIMKKAQPKGVRITFLGQMIVWTMRHLRRRFSGITNDLFNQKAATLHPACRMGWVNNHPDERGMTDTVMNALWKDLREIVQAGASAADSERTEAVMETEPVDTINEVLCSAFASQPGYGAYAPSADERFQEAKLALRSFISDHRSMKAVKPSDFPHPAVKALFVKYNTAMPSSAASERLFAAGRRVIPYLRSRLSDASIEGSLMVSSNSGLDFSA